MTENYLRVWNCLIKPRSRYCGGKTIEIPVISMLAGGYYFWLSAMPGGGPFDEVRSLGFRADEDIHVRWCHGSKLKRNRRLPGIYTLSDTAPCLQQELQKFHLSNVKVNFTREHKGIVTVKADAAPIGLKLGTIELSLSKYDCSLNEKTTVLAKAEAAAAAKESSSEKGTKSDPKPRKFEAAPDPLYSKAYKTEAVEAPKTEIEKVIPGGKEDL